MFAPDRPHLTGPVLGPLAWAAVAAPTLLAFNVSPSATFLNQVLATLLWGLLAAVVAVAYPSCRDAHRQVRWALLAPALLLGGLVAAVALSYGLGSLPSSLALSALASLAAAAVATHCGACMGAWPPQAANALWRALCAGLVLAGLCNVAIALVQVFWPELADGGWVARSGLPGRAVGNLRQPNHVCTLLLWAIVAAVALSQPQAECDSDAARSVQPIPVAPSAALWLALAGLSWALVATASRSALLGLTVLLGWGLIDRSLVLPLRRALVATPVLYAASWALMSAWAKATEHTFGAQERLAESDLSASRLSIWKDSLTLLGQHPWSGVGFGEFNFAWSLTPLPTRPVAFFDHTHNLVLQWAVELGLPMALALSGLLLWALLRVWRSAAAPAPSHESRLRQNILRPLLVCLLIVALHSQLEYPLWYAYFLLPTACLMGLGLSLSHRQMQGAGQTADPPGAEHGQHAAVQAGSGAQAAGQKKLSLPRAPVVAGLLLSLGSLLALADYVRVVRIFESESTTPLAERITQGQRSWLFAHHADYAAATVSPEPAQEMDALRRAAHHLLDARLLMAWAEAHASSAELPKARYLAARLREFRNPLSKDYFEVCAALQPQATGASEAAAAAGPAHAATAAERQRLLPYQCRGPDAQVILRWTDFR